MTMREVRMCPFETSVLAEPLTPEGVRRESAADALIEEAGSLKNWIDSFSRVVPTGSIAHVSRAIDELGAALTSMNLR